VSTPTGAPPSGPAGAPASAPTGASLSGPATEADGRAFHALSADLVLQAERVDAQRGLSSPEAASRAARFGPNKFAEAAAEPRWRAFIRQYADPMQIVLLVAGVGSLWPLKELATVFGPLPKLLGTTSLDVQQWLICSCVALSIIVVSEIRKVIRRRAAGPVLAGTESPTEG
jgi:magnesium-transporting ATPase (P-type)